MVAPKRPSSRIVATIACGYSSRCSSAEALGMTSRSTKRRTAATISRSNTSSITLTPENPDLRAQLKWFSRAASGCGNGLHTSRRQPRVSVRLTQSIGERIYCERICGNRHQRWRAARETGGAWQRELHGGDLRALCGDDRGDQAAEEGATR